MGAKRVGLRCSIASTGLARLAALALLVLLKAPPWAIVIFGVLGATIQSLLL